MEIYDLNPYPKSDRNGTYGGNAGSKEGILIDGEYWIVKYPKNTRSMERVALSYATTPLSEYLGSHIYGILGYDVHETRLGIRNNKLVVACRDFCGKNETLMELRTIKNAYSEELEKALDQAAISDSDRHMVDLVELVLQLNHNSVLSEVEGVKNRFWECSVVDVLINNNDRNNGNWGLVKTEDSYRLAPVFDNGASFFNKIDVVKMERLMSAPNFEKMISDSIQTIYGVNGKIMSAKKFLQYDEAGLKKAITRVVPKITEHLSEIKSFIDAIPEEYEGVSVMPKTQKKYYQKSLQANYDYLLKPAYERVLEVVKEA